MRTEFFEVKKWGHIKYKMYNRKCFNQPLALSFFSLD